MRPEGWYCADDPDCLGTYVHSGPHTPGCRICEARDHTPTACPHHIATRDDELEAPMPPLFPQLDREELLQSLEVAVIAFAIEEESEAPGTQETRD